MGKLLVGALIAVLVGTGVATGVTAVLSSQSSPDNSVDFDTVKAPNNAKSSGGTVDYGSGR